MSRRMASAYRLARLAPLLLLPLASCIAPRPAPPAAPPPAAPPQPMPVAPPASDDWRDLPRTPGDWRWSSTGGARFVAPDGQAMFTLRCDLPARRLLLVRAGTARGQAIVMAFTTSAGSFAYAAAGDGAAITAQAPAADRDLDRIAFSRGRFIVAATGTARLALPADPEVGRVIEDCRG